MDECVFWSCGKVFADVCANCVKHAAAASWCCAKRCCVASMSACLARLFAPNGTLRLFPVSAAAAGSLLSMIAVPQLQQIQKKKKVGFKRKTQQEDKQKGEKKKQQKAKRCHGGEKVMGHRSKTVKKVSF